KCWCRASVQASKALPFGWGMVVDLFRVVFGKTGGPCEVVTPRLRTRRQNSPRSIPLDQKFVAVEAVLLWNANRLTPSGSKYFRRRSLFCTPSHISRIYIMKERESRRKPRRCRYSNGGRF